MKPLFYLHPVFAVVALGLAWLTFRKGFRQRMKRLRGREVPPVNLALHLKWGPWSVMAIAATAMGGVTSAVGLRGWTPLGTTHGVMGLVSSGLFLALWWLGRRAHRHPARAGTHGVLGLVALFAGGLTAVLGIALLP